MSFLFNAGEEDSPPKMSLVKTNIKEANDHIKALSERVSELEGQRDQLSDHLRLKASESDSLKNSLHQFQEILSDRDVQCKNLEITVHGQQEIIVELEARLLHHQQALQSKSDALESLEALLDEKEAVYERIQEKVAEYQRVLIAKDDVVSNLSSGLEAALAENESCRKIAEDNAALLEQHEETLKTVDALEERCRCLETTIESYSRKAEALKKILAFSSSIESFALLMKRAAYLPNLGENVTTEAGEETPEQSEPTNESGDSFNISAETPPATDEPSVEDSKEQCEFKTGSRLNRTLHDDRVASILLFNGDRGSGDEGDGDIESRSSLVDNGKTPDEPDPQSHPVENGDMGSSEGSSIVFKMTATDSGGSSHEAVSSITSLAEKLETPPATPPPFVSADGDKVVVASQENGEEEPLPQASSPEFFV